MVEQIAEEVSPDLVQYGGIKDSGTEHFLLDTWDKTLQGLDDHSASIILISLE